MEEALMREIKEKFSSRVIFVGDTNFPKRCTFKAKFFKADLFSKKDKNIFPSMLSSSGRREKKLSLFLF